MARMRWITTVLICFIVALAHSQSSFEVPKLAFGGWQEQGSNGEQIEYVASFPSAFRSGIKENDNVQLRIFLPELGPEKPPMVLVLHYWGASNLRLERALALDLNRRGIGAAVLSLPYHLSRAPKGTSSGELAIQPDPQKLVATMSQAVMDVRRSLDFIESRKECGPILGIHGTSLGAIVSSLAYANDPRLKNAVFLLGGIDLSKIIFESSRVQPIREALRKKGLSEVSLREALSIVEPANYLPKKEPGRTLVIRAAFDTVIPSECTDELIAKLPDSQVLEIDTGHYGGVFVQGRLLRASADFFDAINRNRPFTVPKKVIAPTIRLGFIATTPSDFNIAAGVDLIKFDSSGTRYASILVTPRSPVLWVGTSIATSVTFGVAASNRSVGVGFFWSTVL